MRMKCWCLWQANTMVWPVWGPEKNKAAVSALCVWCGRDSVCQIPFPLAKEKLPSPTHTPDVLPTSASWDTHTHTLGFPSPRRCTHPRSCKLQDSKQIFPQPKMAVGRWPLLMQTWGESSCCSSSSLTPHIPPDVRNGGSSKNLSGEAYGDLLHTAHKGSLMFAHTLKAASCLDRKGEKWYDLWPSQKYHGKLKIFCTWYPRYFRHFITMLPLCLKNMKIL